MTDARRLVPVKVKKVVATKEIEQIKQIIIEAKDEDLKIFIAGKQHNQGGQTYYKEAIVLDMTTYNKVIKILPEERRKANHSTRRSHLDRCAGSY